MGIRRASIGTTAERTVRNQSILLPTGGAVSTGITTVVYTDSNYNTLTANAAATTYGTFRILGTGFSPGANVLVANTSSGTIANVTSNTTYIGATEIRANVSVTAGNYALYVFNPNGSAAIYYSGVTFQPYPVWTATSYASATTVSVQLLTSSTAVEQPITYSLVSGTLPTGTTLAANGLISGTATGIPNAGQTFTFTVAATDIYNETTQASISLTITVADAYFDYTTLLLNGETNSNTYIQDAGANNFTLTPYGSSTSNRFSPMWGDGYYGNSFDGSSGFLITAANSILAPSADFTAEAWAYTTINNNFQGIMSTRDSGSTTGWGITINSSGYLEFVCTGATAYTGTLAPLNRWFHVAMSKVGSTVYCYLNGVQVGTLPSSPAISYNSLGLSLGRYYSNGSNQYWLNGYISNARYINGTGIYTGSSFTVPTTPLTAIANTAVLTCQSNRFIDNGPNGLAITPSGTVKVVPNQPFGSIPTTSTANTNNTGYYSAQFDGSTGYLNLGGQSTFAFGSNSFTIEAWIYPLTASQTSVITDFRPSGGSGVYQLFYLNSGALTYWVNGTGVIVGSSPVAGVWSHVAVVRNGTSTIMYLNGVQTGSTYSDSNSYLNGANAPVIGGLGYTRGQNIFNGYISNFRIVNGTAVYTSNFTPPTTPLTAVTNTSLLTLQNSVIVDNSANAFTLTPTGSVIVSKNQPFASPTVTSNTITPSVYGSVLLDGSTGYMQVQESSNPAFALSGDFTIELWYYPTGTSGGYIYAQTVSGTNWCIIGASTTTLTAAQFTATTSGAGTAQNSAAVGNPYSWNHLAVCRKSGQVTVYLNGVGGTSVTNTTSIPSTYLPTISGYSHSQTGLFAGYISNIRVINGTAVYTNNFIPPTSPLTAVANTSVLSLQYKNSANNNVYYDDSPNNLVISRTGIPTQGTFSPFSPTGWSNYLGGSGYYIVSNSTPISTTTSTFTIEGWINMSATPGGSANPALIGDMNPTAGTCNWSFGPNNSNVLELYVVGGTSYTITGNTVMSLGTWYHVAVSVNSNSVSMYVNGVQQTLTGGSTIVNRSGSIGYLTMGQWNSGSFNYAGYVSNLRISNVALYSSSFTPSTAPLTAISSTVFLTAQNNGFVDNSTNGYRLTATQASVQAVSPFAPGVIYNPAVHGASSYHYSGNYIYGSNQIFNVRSPSMQWQFECWVYPVNQSFFFCIGNGGAYGNSFNCGFQGNQFTFTQGNGSNGTVATLNSTTNTYNYNQWYHFAITKNASGVITMWVNGTSQGTVTNTSGTAASGTTFIICGLYDNGGLGYSGFSGGSFVSYFSIANPRFIAGAPIYTSAFTPPTAPVTAVANTALLLNFTNTGIQDATGKNNIITYGSAKTQANTTKFGTGALYFDGSTGYCSFPNAFPTSPYLNLGSNNFTIEFWLYPITFSNGSAFLTKGWTGSYGSFLFYYYNNTTPQIYFYAGSNNSAWDIVNGVSINSNLSSNTWTHIAVTRSGSNFYLFSNGVLTNTVTSSASIYNSTAPVTVGGDNSGGHLSNCYIDDLRITNGVARYTSTFTPTSLAFLTQ